jgi:hypothetical protein
LDLSPSLWLKALNKLVVADGAQNSINQPIVTPADDAMPPRRLGYKDADVASVKETICEGGRRPVFDGAHVCTDEVRATARLRR